MRSCYIKEFGFKDSRVVLIHNGTEIPKTQKSFCEKNNFVIGSAGRLFPVKDYPLMVNIAKETIARVKHIRFVLAGEGPDMDMITGMVREYGIGDRFIWLGS
jgi:glycosyltransferase involved in cell wall biosynthesis